MGLVKRLVKQHVWRQRNRHNFTTAVGDAFPLDRVEVGRWTYGPICAVCFGGQEEFLRIGSCCSIADEVTFLLGGCHIMSRVSTYPFKAEVLTSPNPHAVGPTVLDDDVWIGYGSTVLGGVHIGRGAVVGARALVTKDVPPYAVIGGVPAHVIRYRFDEEMRGRLLALDFGKVDEGFIKDHIDLLEGDLTPKTADRLVQLLAKSTEGKG